MATRGYQGRGVWAWCNLPHTNECQRILFGMNSRLAARDGAAVLVTRVLQLRTGVTGIEPNSSRENPCMGQTVIPITASVTKGTTIRIEYHPVSRPAR